MVVHPEHSSKACEAVKWALSMYRAAGACRAFTPFLRHAPVTWQVPPGPYFKIVLWLLTLTIRLFSLLWGEQVWLRSCFTLESLSMQERSSVLLLLMMFLQPLGYQVVLPSPSSPCICNPRWSLEAPEGLQEWENGRSAIDGGGGSAPLPFSVPRWWHLGLGLWF